MFRGPYSFASQPFGWFAISFFLSMAYNSKKAMTTLTVENKRVMNLLLTRSILVIWIGLIGFKSFADDTITQETVQKRFEEQERESLKPTEAVIEEQRPAENMNFPLKSINQKYLKRLLDQKFARKIDAIYIAVVLLNKQKELITGPLQFSYLKDQGFLPKDETGKNLNERIQKGELAYLLCKVLNIKGGLHLRLFGVSERYALSELIFQDIMVQGNAKELVTGRELVYSFIQSANLKMEPVENDF